MFALYRHSTSGIFSSQTRWTMSFFMVRQGFYPFLSQHPVYKHSTVCTGDQICSIEDLRGRALQDDPDPADCRRLPEVPEVLRTGLGMAGATSSQARNAILPVSSHLWRSNRLVSIHNRLVSPGIEPRGRVTPYLPDREEQGSQGQAYVGTAVCVSVIR